VIELLRARMVRRCSRDDGAMKRLLHDHPLAWLDAGGWGDRLYGYDARGWPASIWILHAMYESRHAPGRESAPGGTAGPPGPDWRRLRWSELAQRLEVDLLADGEPMSLYATRPGLAILETGLFADIAAPSEDEMARDEFLLLIEHLSAATRGGLHAPCIAYYAKLVVGAFEETLIFEGSLGELVELYDTESVVSAAQGWDIRLTGPTNIWPDDRSWFVWTGLDYWGTKVSGDRELVDRLAADVQFETVAIDR
jgi:hypothetical protein